MAGARVVEPREGTLQALDLVRRHARSAVAYLDRHLRIARHELELHRLAGIAQRIVDQVGDGAAHCHAREAKWLHRVVDQPHVLADPRVVLGELAQHLAQVVLLLLLVGAAREIEELADDGIDLVDVGDHRVARLGIGAAHLEREAQPRQRRPQVMRDAGEHHGTIALHALQVRRHAVEGGGHRAQLARPFLGQRLVRLPAPEAQRRAAHGGERARDVRGDEPGAGERQHHHRDQPADPLEAETELEALARQHHPELVLVDEEADEEPFLAVARIGKARVTAERLAHLLHDELEERIVGQRLGLLGRGYRIHAQALGLVQLDEQLPPALGIRIHQRRARQVDGAYCLLRKLARARLALVDAVDLKRGEQRRDDQSRDQQERPREQRHLAGCESSGTNT